jgi:hypothetical protein
MARANVNQLPVLDEGHLVGFITRAGIVGVMKLREELHPPAKAGGAYLWQTEQHSARAGSHSHPHTRDAGSVYAR